MSVCPTCGHRTTRRPSKAANPHVQVIANFARGVLGPSVVLYNDKRAGYRRVKIMDRRSVGLNFRENLMCLLPKACTFDEVNAMSGARKTGDKLLVIKIPTDA